MVRWLAIRFRQEVIDPGSEYSRRKGLDSYPIRFQNRGAVFENGDDGQAGIGDVFVKGADHTGTGGKKQFFGRGIAQDNCSAGCLGDAIGFVQKLIPAGLEIVKTGKT